MTAIDTCICSAPVIDKWVLAIQRIYEGKVLTMNMFVISH